MTPQETARAMLGWYDGNPSRWTQGVLEGVESSHFGWVWCEECNSTGTVDPDADATEALALSLLEGAAPGSTPSAERPCAPVPNAKLIDLFEALKASLERAS